MHPSHILLLLKFASASHIKTQRESHIYIAVKDEMTDTNTNTLIKSLSDWTTDHI